MICGTGGSPACGQRRAALEFARVRADNPTRYDSAVDDVQRPFFDVQRGFPDGFA